MNYKHGKANTRVYAVWNAMRSRCTNPNNPAYDNYGKRGITICERWLDFQAFYSDMGDPPKGQTLERVDNDKGYSPENCRWAGRKTQGRNKRNNHLLTVDGETLPMTVWAEKHNINVATIWLRIRNGWPEDKAVKMPVVKRRAGIPRGTKFYDL